MKTIMRPLIMKRVQSIGARLIVKENSAHHLDGIRIGWGRNQIVSSAMLYLVRV
jgi:Fe-S cluster assembly iron-binding protein IscA